MADIVDIPVADLRFDDLNPRLGTPSAGQRETFRAMALAQGSKLRALAEDIVTYGLDPSDLPIVTSVEGGDNAYVVLDANRRLTALRALENPDALADSGLPNATLRALRDLSRKYQAAPVETVRCVVVSTRDEADHWIELRHQGELGGAGHVDWQPDDIDRWRARNSGVVSLSTQALNFLEKRGLLAPGERRDIATTTLNRLLSTEDVRSAVGVTLNKGVLKATGDADGVAKALRHVVSDILGGMRVNDVYYVQDRIEYAKKLPSSIRVAGIRKPGEAVSLADLPAAGSAVLAPTPRPAVARPVKPRDRLIPSSCILQVTDPRIRSIERELRTLSLDSYTNAVAVLFRVFLELSADDFVDAASVSLPASGPNGASLGNKLKATADHLVKQKKLDSAQAAPVRKAAQAGSFIGPTATTFNQWVHNQYMVPSPTDLRATWDSLQPWFVAVWST